MKYLLQIVLSIALLVFALSVVFLLNFTAPNPTHRRYSSEMPLIKGQPKQIGDDGERILSNDLRLPNNNSSGQRQCICGSASSNGNCNVCIARIPMAKASSYRMPDFVGSDFIADSKNEQGLLYMGNLHDTEQIRDFVVASLLSNRRLYIYVRTNTVVSGEFVQLVESTGGAVIPYFTIPGYVDPVDNAAGKGAVVSGATIAGLILFEWQLFRRRKRVKKLLPDNPQPKPSDGGTPITGSGLKISVAEDYVSKTKDRLRTQIDEEDEWNDL